MKIPNYIKWIFLSRLLLIISCQDIINIDLDKIERNSVVVQGKMVITDTTRVNVQIRRLFDFTASGASGIVAERVILHDDKGRKKELQRSFRSNFKIAIENNDPTFPITTEGQYYIEVYLNDGRVFFSDWVSPMEAPPINEVSYELVETAYGYHMNLFTSTTLWENQPSDHRYINWHLESTYRFSQYKYANHDFEYCYVSGGTLQYEPQFIDAASVADGYIDKILLYDSRVDYRFAEGIVFTLYQESVTREVFDFYKNVTIMNNKNGTMFDLPPGTLPTNIRSKNYENEVTYGIFYATKPSVKRIYISPEIVGNPERRCASIQTSSLPECLSCIRLENSTRVKPEFWPH